jgi:hypothetical protein
MTFIPSKSIEDLKPHVTDHQGRLDNQRRRKEGGSRYLVKHSGEGERRVPEHGLGMIEKNQVRNV